MNTEIREKVTEWLTGNDTCLLLGAGCSKCAGKPLIGELTDTILASASIKLKEQFNNLTTSGNRPATIEDLINYLVRYRSILSTIDCTDSHSLSIDEIDTWLDEIKQNIVNTVADDWDTSPTHERFLQRLCSPGDHRTRDIFSLNYDTLLEASLDSLRLPYVDGFRGTNRGWFDPTTFDEVNTAPAYRLYKLHGSINWTRDTDGHVRRGCTAIADGVVAPIVVYPSEQKYIQTQYGIYETLMGNFRDRLRNTRVNNCLIVLGYSFNDEHINEVICDAITANGSNLTVIAFVGPEEDHQKQNRRLTTFSTKCDSRFTAFVGDDKNGTFVGNALDPDSATHVLALNLWKFEELVNFIAGQGQ